LTFDPSSSLEKQNDPDALIDFRTPRFDLDNIYGRGPDDQPYLYQGDGIRMLLGRVLSGNSNDPNARDLPRNSLERALIGDPRNDENVIVSQVQATMLRFHNRVADVMGANDPNDFPDIQQAVRWHYQWMVLHDFLPTIIGESTLNDILPHLAEGGNILETPANLKFYRPKKDAYMPVEFSVAAYRFGHSMVRPQYRLNEKTPPEEGNPNKDGTNDPRLPIFAESPKQSLVGFRAFPDTWAVDWRLFFKMGDTPPKGKGRIQPAYKIDSSIVNPLGDLPVSVTGLTVVHSLAHRNLLRGLRMGLPSGQAVARAMGIKVIEDENLKVGKANESDTGTNPLLTSLSPEFVDNAPLWYYILAESQQVFKNNSTPIRLGPVGGRIVGEVFVGLMIHDPHSFLRQDPRWQPLKDFRNSASGKFGMAELITQAMQAK
jgi:hypothetical protein